ncbi:hypothetical protein HN51_008182 [Arachis hypogaea]
MSTYPSLTSQWSCRKLSPAESHCKVACSTKCGLCRGSLVRRMKICIVSWPELHSVSARLWLCRRRPTMKDRSGMGTVGERMTKEMADCVTGRAG